MPSDVAHTSRQSRAPMQTRKITRQIFWALVRADLGPMVSCMCAIEGNIACSIMLMPQRGVPYNLTHAKEQRLRTRLTLLH